MKKFKLSNRLGTNNMHLFGPDRVIKKYDNPEQIIEDFYEIKLELYKKRKVNSFSRPSFSFHFLILFIHGCYVEHFLFPPLPYDQNLLYLVLAAWDSGFVSVLYQYMFLILLKKRLVLF